MRLGSPDWKKLQSHPNQSNVKGKKNWKKNTNFKKGTKKKQKQQKT